MEQDKITRINELARKSKIMELSDEEKQEQYQLRQEFLADFRANFRQQLERIELVDDDNIKS